MDDTPPPSPGAPDYAQPAVPLFITGGGKAPVTIIRLDVDEPQR